MKEGSVRDAGAKAGDILIGRTPVNLGMKIQVEADQSRFNANSKNPKKTITGWFEIIEPGDGVFSEVLNSLVGKRTYADEVVEEIKRKHPSASHPFRKNNIFVLQEYTVIYDIFRRGGK